MNLRRFAIMTNWIPDPAALARPAYLSLAEQFARAIERGALPAGARLVPHRKLADALGLSVQTVSRAYDELIRRGLITGEVGRGSFVLGPGAEARQPYLPERPGEVIDLSILKPVVEAMHLDRLREGFLWLGENLAASSAMSFRPNMVMPQHQATGADWLMRQGIPAEPQGIIVTNGATPAITAAVMGVVPPGSGLAAEALTHHTLKPLCTYLGLHLEGVAMDGAGMLPAGLDEVARKGLIRGVYLQPNVINPLAVMMPAERRAELVEVARRHDLAIIENDILNVMIPDLRFHQDHRPRASHGLSSRAAPPCHRRVKPPSGGELDGDATHGGPAEPLGRQRDRGRTGGLAGSGAGRPACARRGGAWRTDALLPRQEPASLAAPDRGLEGGGIRRAGAPARGRRGCGKRFQDDRARAAGRDSGGAWLDPDRGVASGPIDNRCDALRRAGGAAADDLMGGQKIIVMILFWN
jgi:DNA-binding transcriptional regulator YhcF (GntR family)